MNHSLYSTDSTHQRINEGAQTFYFASIEREIQKGDELEIIATTNGKNILKFIAGHVVRAEHNSEPIDIVSLIRATEIK